MVSTEGGEWEVHTFPIKKNETRADNRIKERLVQIEAL